MRKSNYLIILLVLVSMHSCKKEYTCAKTYITIPFRFVFQGIDTTSLDTIIVHRYKPDTTFTHFVATDTIITDGFTIEDDLVARQNNFGFGDLTHAYDYLITNTESEFEFKISEIVKGADYEYYTQSEPCNVKGTFIKPYNGAKVNGAPAKYKFTTSNQFKIILKK